MASFCARARDDTTGGQWAPYDPHGSTGRRASALSGATAEENGQYRGPLGPYDPPWEHWSPSFCTRARDDRGERLQGASGPPMTPMGALVAELLHSRVR